MMDRDQLIVLAAAAPGVLGFAVAIALTHDLAIAALIGGVTAVIAAALSLTPPVRRARLRLLKRKYPPEA
ncbi:MAG: hypothetical protein K5831_03825 [Brevundimonas sp.]|uniref:hypothetical protein n=1 Tax=Brevundimonas sp. TaxID=1871086 RepID=UPI00258BBD58|nr:hypothetical protein [Brevundimonas sp.]MCV0413991.1 hypothetical protein [Brevundimonas sp.]